MASLLSPFATPFVPAGAEELSETLERVDEPQPLPPDADLLTAASPGPVPMGGKMWMWPETLPQGMSLLPPPLLPAWEAGPPFMTPFSLPVVPQLGFYPPTNFMWPPPTHPSQPLLPPDQTALLSNPSRKKKRKARSGRKENGEETKGRPTFRVIYAEAAVQTDFPESIAETCISRLPTGLYVGPTGRTPNRRPFDRFEVDFTGPLRSVAAWTAEDLLHTLQPIRPPEPTPLLPNFSYAAALKASPATPATHAASARREPAPDKEKKKKKNKKKKAKAPVIDLAAVKAEEEAARRPAPAPLPAPTLDDDFPGLGAALSPASAPVWIRSGEMTPGLLSLPPDTAWRRPGATSLWEAALGRTEERPNLPTRAEEPTEVVEMTRKEKRSGGGGRTKFMPLFSAGGGAAGAAGAGLFRPPEGQSLSGVAEKAKVEIGVREWPPTVRPDKEKKTTQQHVKMLLSRSPGKGINPLDSGVTMKRGKEREKPKAKKHTPMKQIILRERQLKKTRRLESLTDRKHGGDDPGAVSCPETGRLGALTSDEEELAASAPEDDSRPVTQESEKPSVVIDDWEKLASDKDEEKKILTNVGAPALHSRRFRDYCNQMIGKAVNECVLAILTDLVRFQDRLHSRDPMKAKQRRRLVYGIKEVTKHVRLGRVKLVIISPDVEKIESEGGLDDAIRNLLDLCVQQDILHVFSMPRRLLGRTCMKSVPISVVGVFNYEGTERNVRRLQSLVDEGRRQYRLVIRMMESETPSEEESSWKMKHSRNASSVSEPISDLPPGGHSRQSSCGGPINLVMRNVSLPPETPDSPCDYEADDESDV